LRSLVIFSARVRRRRISGRRLGADMTVAPLDSEINLSGLQVAPKN
jgi:hypothetical protein